METSQTFSVRTRIVAVPGQRDALAEILLKGSRNTPGCINCVVTTDPYDESSLWINEVWESEATRQSALALPEMKEATRTALPMIAGIGHGMYDRG